jgi:VIT1/CCC1 family predicted Fe2+/Mn2+ transporter
MELEIEHLEHHREHELQEIRDMFGDDGMGLPTDDVEHIVNALDKDDAAFLKTMMALEFGVVEKERRSPYAASALSGVLFLSGSLPSVLPFVFIDSTSTALAVAAVAAGLALFGVGVLKTMVTRKSWLWAGTENVLIATVGAIVSYGVGALYNAHA